MGCGAAEATGLGFVCYVVINPHVLSASRVDLGFLFHKFSNFTPLPSSNTIGISSMDAEGALTCLEGFAAPNCVLCSKGYYNPGNTSPPSCITNGLLPCLLTTPDHSDCNLSLTEAVASNGICTCKNHATGVTCDKCDSVSTLADDKISCNGLASSSLLFSSLSSPGGVKILSSMWVQ